jgi:hypothetical protein
MTRIDRDADRSRSAVVDWMARDPFEQLNHTGVPAMSTDESSPAPPPSSGPDPAAIKHAMKAFRKRLKLARLDDESKIGNRQLTGGRQSSIVAIQAPYGHPKEVWDELVRQGKLKDVGRGFYELNE